VSPTAGFDVIAVTIVRGDVRSTLEFLIAKDNSILILEKLDLAQLPASTIDLAGRPIRGNPKAQVTIINFDDFQCPYCQMMHNQLTDQVLKVYGDKVKIVYKDFPLVGIHPWATHAHVNANCVAEQNHEAYWAYADHVHQNLRQISAGEKGEKRSLDEQHKRLDDAAFNTGKKYSLDRERLGACVKKQDDSLVKRSIAEGEGLEIQSTPVLFVNGQRIEGAIPIEDLRHVIDRALVAAGEQPPVQVVTPTSSKQKD
jgi:protein-disulfide isomerase